MLAIFKYGSSFPIEAKDFTLLTYKTFIPLEQECTEYWSNVLSKCTFSVKGKIKMSNIYIFQKYKVSTDRGKTKVN